MGDNNLNTDEEIAEDVKIACRHAGRAGRGLCGKLTKTIKNYLFTRKNKNNKNNKNYPSTNYSKNTFSTSKRRAGSPPPPMKSEKPKTEYTRPAPQPTRPAPQPTRPAPQPTRPERRYGRYGPSAADYFTLDPETNGYGRSSFGTSSGFGAYSTFGKQRPTTSTNRFNFNKNYNLPEWLKAERIKREQRAAEAEQQRKTGAQEKEEQQRRAREQAEREEQQRRAREQAEREEQQRRAREQAEREEQQRRAREKAEREEQQRRAREQAEREEQQRRAEQERRSREQTRQPPKSHLETLEINKNNYNRLNSKGKQSLVKKQYRKLALERHPNKGGTKEEFQKLQEAYDTLKSGGSRKTRKNRK
jgi:flagellar biosynthesis GTPase FlhF